MNDLPTRVALVEQRMKTFEKSFEQYADERKAQHAQLEEKLDWVTRKVLLGMGGIGVLSIVAQAILHYLK